MKFRQNQAISAAVIISALFVIGAGDANARAAKKFTITDRQVALRDRVNKGFKSNELTEKEAKRQIERLDQLDKDITKMKSKNAGQLTYKDQGKVEKRLNSISLDVEAAELKKRVTSK